MKKVIAIIITLIVILTGCSKYNSAANNIAQNQPQPENLTQGAKDTTGNTDLSIIDNIDSNKSIFEKGYYDYEGTIGDNMSVQMSIYPLEKDIAGSYFYENQKKEISLKGKSGAEDIVLYEYDEKGKHTGIFKGKMATVDKIEGTWISADNKDSYPFTLSLKSILPGAEYGKRYAVAVGTLSDQDVESFASKAQGYIVSDDKQQLAEVIAYPINVKINDKVTKIQNKDDFIKNYDKIFHSNFKQAISTASTKYMFANWQGIMFGEGSYNVWINEVAPTNEKLKLVITAINN
jgi:hypothetical protein